jgi:hypothetical protein
MTAFTLDEGPLAGKRVVILPSATKAANSPHVAACLSAMLIADIEAND